MFVRIILDTCTVRNHIDGCAPQLDLAAIKRCSQDVRISVAASAFVELMAQLADGRVPFHNWKERIGPINEVLDPRWPCFPNGKQLAWLAGIQTREPIESVEDESRYMRACWHHLLDVAPDEIGKCQVVYRVSDGSLKSIRLKPKELRDTMSGQRQNWIDYIHRMQADLPARGFTAADEESIFQVMQSDFGSDPWDGPNIALKLDAPSRMIARFVARSLPSKIAPYNPESEKRRGDTFDLNLLYYVPLPGVIVTGDNKFVRGLRETDTLHGNQVLMIDEFNQHLADGTLATLVSHFRTPEQQQREHFETAFFRWEKRGQPPNDDWADWYVSEPVA